MPGTNSDYSWDAWPRYCADLFGTSYDPDKPVRIGTMCSGTDSCILAGQQLLTSNNVVHVYSIENGRCAQRFLFENFAPLHFYDDVCNTRRPTMHCSKYDSLCSAYKEEVDLLVAGFPCQPFSVTKECRFAEGYDAFTQDAAKPCFGDLEVLEVGAAAR